MASAITIPSGIGECATEVASNNAARGDETAELANAVIDLATTAKSEITSLQTDVAATVGVVHRTVTLDYSADSFSGLANGVKTKTKAIGATLPANARFAGVVVGSGTFVAFDDAAHGTYTIKVGSAADDDAIVATANVAAGQSGFPKTGTLGVKGFAAAPLAAEVHNLILTSSVDLNTATAGTLTVDLFYYVLA